MIFVDTNALLSVLLPGHGDDHRAVVERARDLGGLVVCEAVLAETLRVLENVYGMGRRDAAVVVRDILGTEGIDAWEPFLADEALRLMAASPKLSIVDSILAVRARLGHAVLTFDRGLAREIERD